MALLITVIAGDLRNIFLRVLDITSLFSLAFYGLSGISSSCDKIIVLLFTSSLVASPFFGFFLFWAC